jgi:hypothetical protein
LEVYSKSVVAIIALLVGLSASCAAAAPAGPAAAAPETGAAAPQGAGSYWLMVPPEFIGQPAAGSVPNRNWMNIGEYATQGDCETAKQSASVEFFNIQVDNNGVQTPQHTLKSVPANAACVPSNSFDGSYTVSVPSS